MTNFNSRPPFTSGRNPPPKEIVAIAAEEYYEVRDALDDTISEIRAQYAAGWNDFQVVMATYQTLRVSQPANALTLLSAAAIARLAKLDPPELNR